MPIQKTDRDTQWTVTANDQTWTLATNATISVENQNGIFENGFSGSEIRVLGDITVSGEFAAVHLTSANSSVWIGEDSRIKAKEMAAAIHHEGVGGEIVNNGRVSGNTYGIFGDNWADVTNNGKIVSDGIGIAFETVGAQIVNKGSINASNLGIDVELGGAEIINGKDATIDGSHGIVTSGAGQGLIVNKGVISGDYNAVQDGDGALTLINRGDLKGFVSLGGGDDTLDTRKGRIEGALTGGDGNDKFLVSRDHFEIREYDGGGQDEVVSTASFRLDQWIEKLTLAGQKDVNASGNDQSNTLNGNKGDNHLSGKAGVDYLNGSRGNDLLTGGADADVFLFNRTDGKDVINDFADGIDRLYIEGVFNQETFDELEIRQAKDDVIVDFGGGNSIRIENLEKANFTFDDIILLV
jgi:Ca2+-binding RTX toxin-like protein